MSASLGRQSVQRGSSVQPPATTMQHHQQQLQQHAPLLSHELDDSTTQLVSPPRRASKSPYNVHPIAVGGGSLAHELASGISGDGGEGAMAEEADDDMAYQLSRLAAGPPSLNTHALERDYPTNVPASPTPLLSHYHQQQQQQHHPPPQQQQRSHCSPYLQMHTQASLPSYHHAAHSYRDSVATHFYRDSTSSPTNESQPLFDGGGHASSAYADVEEVDFPISDTDHSEAEKTSPALHALHQPMPFYFASLPLSSIGNLSSSTASSHSSQLPHSSSSLQHQHQLLHQPVQTSHVVPLTAAEKASQQAQQQQAAYNYNLSKKDDAYRDGRHHPHPTRFTSTNDVPSAINVILQSGKKAQHPGGQHGGGFVTRQLTKLKAVSHIVQVRVQRALSVGQAGHLHSNPLLVGGGSSGLGGGAVPTTFERFKQTSVRRWKEVPVGLREKLLFLLSSLLGTVFFFILFESFTRVSRYNLQLNEEQEFMVSYVAAYLLSIVYSHMLNRLLIFRSAPYCASLMHTYFVYSISMCVLTTLGAVLIRVAHVNPRVIACITLPASGIANFYLLRMCLEGNSSMAPSSGGSHPPDKLPERGLLILEKTHVVHHAPPTLTGEVHTEGKSLGEHAHAVASSAQGAIASTLSSAALGLQLALQGSPPAPGTQALAGTQPLQTGVLSSPSSTTSSSGGRRFTVGSGSSAGGNKSGYPFTIA